MTIKEFSDKYKVPYKIVFDSSFPLKPYTSYGERKQYDEEDLICAVLSTLHKKRDKAREVFTKASRMITEVLEIEYSGRE